MHFAQQSKKTKFTTNKNVILPYQTSLANHISQIKTVLFRLRGRESVRHDGTWRLWSALTFGLYWKHLSLILQL